MNASAVGRLSSRLMMWTKVIVVVRQAEKTLHRRGTNTAAPRKDKAVLQLPCTVRSFSEAAGVSAVLVSLKMKAMGIDANINSNMSSETAQLVAVELNVDLDFREPESLEENVINVITAQEDVAEDLEPRPRSSPSLATSTTARLRFWIT